MDLAATSIMTLQANSEPRTRAQLADVIERRSADIVARWLERVRIDAQADHVPTTDLRDGIHDYLNLLVRLLRGGDGLEQLGAAAWADVAREHALTRVRLGFDIAQLFHELVLLRRVTAEVLREEGHADASLIEPLTELIDPAIEASLKSYVDSRDYAARRVEAEHIGFLTHELKNPLGAVLLACDQLRAGALTDGQRRLCDVMARNLGRVRLLLDETLVATRLQADAMENRPADVTVGQLLGDTLDFFRRLASDKGVRVDAHYDPELVIHVDPALTASAAENLLENAVKYTDHGVVTLDVEERPDAVVFHVRDQCSGISEEELRVIFEPFRRAHSRKPGTGLGLSIAQRAIELQGGAIHAESSTETGCHFWFELPQPHH